MQSDKTYLLDNDGLSFIKKSMKEVFRNNVKLLNEDCDLKHHGWFILKYEYLPKEYFILFEGEFNTFNVRINNKEGGFISLKQLTDFDNSLLKEDITCSISKMKEQLHYSINFYKLIDDKLYQQIVGEYKRVKGW